MAKPSRRRALDRGPHRLARRADRGGNSRSARVGRSRSHVEQEPVPVARHHRLRRDFGHGAARGVAQHRGFHPQSAGRFRRPLAAGAQLRLVRAQARQDEPHRKRAVAGHALHVRAQRQAHQQGARRPRPAYDRGGQATQVCIPTKSAGASERNQPPVPRQTSRAFRGCQPVAVRFAEGCIGRGGRGARQACCCLAARSLRMLSPFSSRRWAPCTSLSSTASAMVTACRCTRCAMARRPTGPWKTA